MSGATLAPATVELAVHAGFCSGVRRAVERAEGLIAEGAGELCMWGELIHNPRVVAGLAAGGMRVVQQLEELEGTETVLIRAHGIHPATRAAIEARGCTIVDATCPYVLTIHRIVREAHERGDTVYVTGDPGHPEVLGICGAAADRAIVLRDVEDARALADSEGPAILVSQTTFSVASFAEIRELLAAKIAMLRIFDTICKATENRQSEAHLLAQRSDVMLVIGSRTSSNTMKLMTTCAEAGGAAHLIEAAEDVRDLLESGVLAGKRIGVTAGASTPDSTIMEVVHVMSENDVIGNGQEPMQQEQEQALETDQMPATTQEPETAQETTDEAVAETVEQPVESTDATQEATAGELEETEPAAEVAEATEEPEAVEEAKEESAEVSFADIIDQIPELHRGATVKGLIIRYDDDFVYVDVKDKSEGRIPKHEFDATPEFDLDAAVAEHQEIDVYVRTIRNTDMGKEIILSKARVDFAKFKAQVEQAYNERTPITVKVVNVVKDGIIATYGGIDIYVHRTQLEIGTVEDLEPYRDTSFDILVTQFDPEKRRLRVSGSRRALLNRERKAKAEELWATIAIGDIYDGIVRSLTDFGAFVDIGGVDGLVHISELSWTRIKHPSEVLKTGDVIQVYVKDFDPERKRISLGYKRIEDDPYHNIEERFPVGSVVHGKVVRMFNFGAFVELEEGVDALCHISQISTQRLNAPQDVLTEGMMVDARVLDVSNESRRISISIRDVAPIDAPDAPAGDAAPAGGERGERRGRRGRREDHGPTSYQDSDQGTTLGAMLAGFNVAGSTSDEDAAEDEVEVTETETVDETPETDAPAESADVDETLAHGAAVDSEVAEAADSEATLEQAAGVEGDEDTNEG